ncbi:unnamed protein product [Caenorhabditis auriculariae]|uniref:ZSWIM3 N-terminal domain-containing protein n=1 Tax=Caenorhabditis auriculariae TaxID=2777116 RepID=A0A8S1HZ00_9PELO|nr:unnamed protein product [Caenorhabditis auriculariae]
MEEGESRTMLGGRRGLAERRLHGAEWLRRPPYGSRLWAAPFSSSPLPSLSPSQSDRLEAPMANSEKAGLAVRDLVSNRSSHSGASDCPELVAPSSSSSMSLTGPPGIPPLTLDMFNSFVAQNFATVPPPPNEPQAKRGRYDAWTASSGSSGSSPTQLEEAQMASNAANATAPPQRQTGESGSVSEDESQNSRDGPKDATNAPSATGSMESSAVPSPKPLPLVIDPNELIHQESKFYSFLEFDETFEKWKRQYMHPFRVASSEALREPDGTINQTFKYRYVVFHCAHYGEPRMRGIGKRPNQNYLPCGCGAMLRLNYSFNDKCLKITTLNPIHNGHEVSMEMYLKVAQKIRRSVAADHRRASSGFAVKAEESHQTTPSPLSQRNAATPLGDRKPQLPTASVMAPPAAPVAMNLMQQQFMQQQMAFAAAAAQQQQAQASAFSPALASSQVTQMAMAQYLQQYQMIQYLTQQKENMSNAAAAVAAAASPAVPYPAPASFPSSSSGSKRPWSAVVAASPEGTATEQAQQTSYASAPLAESVYIRPPSNLPAPIPIRPAAAPVAVAAPIESPPVLEAQRAQENVEVQKETERPSQSEISSLLADGQRLLVTGDETTSRTRMEQLRALITHWEQC